MLADPYHVAQTTPLGLQFGPGQNEFGPSHSCSPELDAFLVSLSGGTLIVSVEEARLSPTTSSPQSWSRRMRLSQSSFVTHFTPGYP